MKSNLKLTLLDKILEWTTAAALLGTLIYLLTVYGSLPDQICSGASRASCINVNVIWIPVIVVSLICWGIFKLNRHPELLNFRRSSERPFRKKAYHLATQLLRWISLYAALAVLAVSLTIIGVTKGNLDQRPSFVLPLFLILFMGTPIFYAVKAYTLPKE